MTEWLIDEYGKKYRWEGKCKAYEGVIQTTYGAIPESQYDDFIKRKSEADKEALRKRQEESRAYNARPSCPLIQGLDRHCKADKCAMYKADKCMLKTGLKPIDTKGKFCPISNKACETTCTFYENGCLVPDISKGVTEHG